MAEQTPVSLSHTPLFDVKDILSNTKRSVTTGVACKYPTGRGIHLTKLHQVFLGLSRVVPDYIDLKLSPVPGHSPWIFTIPFEMPWRDCIRSPALSHSVKLSHSKTRFMAAAICLAPKIAEPG